MEDLKELDNLFNEVKDLPADDDYPRLPDGVYKAVVDDAEYTISNAGNRMIVISYKVVEGENADFIHKQFNLLVGKNNEQTASYLKRLSTLMKKFGLNTDKGLTGVVKNLKQLLDREVTITLKTTTGKNGIDFTHTNVEVQ